MSASPQPPPEPSPSSNQFMSPEAHEVQLVREKFADNLRSLDFDLHEDFASVLNISARRTVANPPMKPLDESPFSQHFNRLIWIGGWLPQVNDHRQKRFFLLYKSFMNLSCLIGCLSLFTDLYLVFGDFKKMVWNLCVSVLFVGSFTKMLQIGYHRDMINALRLKLHTSAESKASAEYAPIHDTALRELRLLRMTLYGSATVFIPIWLLTRYFARLRELPLPLRLPFEVDLDNETQYALAFALTGSAGIFGLVFGMENEMAMFSIFIQLSREYRILIKDISKLNRLYVKTNAAGKVEVNPMLRKSKARIIIKNLSTHQKEIIECAQMFERCYTNVFLQQFFGVSVLMTLLGLQCMLENLDVYGSLMYQIGYLFVIVVNTFMICWFSTRLKLLCFEVSETAYATDWYEMERDTCRSLVMIILRAQHPPRITTGKLGEVNVATFMNRLSNICSWLVLLWQLQLNTKPKDSS